MTRFELDQLQQNPDLVARNPELSLFIRPIDQTEFQPPTFASEAEFQNAVIKFARAQGWKVYHTHDSRHSEKGFPDLFMLRPTKDNEFVEGVVFECKMAGKKLTKAQAQWLELLNRVPGIRARVVWPADWEKIEALLK